MGSEMCIRDRYMIMSLMDNDNPVFKAFGVDKDKNVTEHVLEIV